MNYLFVHESLARTAVEQTIATYMTVQPVLGACSSGALQVSTVKAVLSLKVPRLNSILNSRPLFGLSRDGHAITLQWSPIVQISSHDNVRC